MKISWRQATAFLSSPGRVGLLAGALVFAGVVLLRLSGGLESMELAAYDVFLRWQPDSATPDDRIVLIKVTDDDIAAQGQWPLSDATLARALRALGSRRPRAIGLDIYRDVPVPPGRDELDTVLLGHPQIVATMKFPEGASHGILPPRSLYGTERVGFNDILPDPGGIVRRGLLFLHDTSGTAHYSFALRLALLFLQADGRTLQPDPREPEYLRLGTVTIRPIGPDDGGYVGADARGYQFLLDFKGGRTSFLSFSLSHLLADAIPRQAIENKVVLLGIDAEGVKDFFYTPHSRRLQAGQNVPGIAVHGHVVSQLLRMGLDDVSPVRTPPKWQEWIWIAAWAAAGALVGSQVRSPWRFVLVGVGGYVALGAMAYGAFLARWWIPLAAPVLSWMATATLVTASVSYGEKQQRALLMQLFAQHVSPEVAETIWQERHQFLDGGRPRTERLIATVLFTDLVGFTSTAEKQAPQALVDWLNEYMEVMARQILERGGLINKYIGDSIMAVFGVPLARETEAEISEDAIHAVDAALAMGRELATLNRRWQEQGLPTAAQRIGIFTGPVVAGSIGSTQRLEYTVIGDTVNIAARLEGFAKEGFAQELSTGGSGVQSCRVLIGESTLKYLGDQFRTQPVETVALKGKEETIAIHRVFGRE